MRWIALLLIMAILTGCSSAIRWQKVGLNQEEFRHDDISCIHEANLAAGPQPTPGQSYINTNRQYGTASDTGWGLRAMAWEDYRLQVYKGCMMKKGYYEVR